MEYTNQQHGTKNECIAAVEHDELNAQIQQCYVCLSVVVYTVVVLIEEEVVVLNSSKQHKEERESITLECSAAVVGLLQKKQILSCMHAWMKMHYIINRVNMMRQSA